MRTILSKLRSLLGRKKGETPKRAGRDARPAEPFSAIHERRRALFDALLVI